MCSTKNISWAAILSFFIFVFAPAAFADEDSASQPLFFTSSYQNEFGWRLNAGDYNVPMNQEIPLETSLGGISGDSINAEDITLQIQEGSDKGPESEEDYIGKIMNKIPYSKQMKTTWKFIDGETDIYVEGLRVDRGNKGVAYYTSALPFIGEIEGVRFTAEAGEDSKLRFESNAIPFIGTVEGFEFKSSVGENSKVSIRYRMDLP